MKFTIGLDIGGSHIAGALVDMETGNLLGESYCKSNLNANADAETIIGVWADVIRRIAKHVNLSAIEGIGMAMPGPFDYEKGISWMKDLGKYDNLYGINVTEALKKELHLYPDFPVMFQNDAICFALGEYESGAASGCRNVVALTLGTGFGAAFIREGKYIQSGQGVPPGGTLYQIQFQDATAEEYFSARGLCRQYTLVTGNKLDDAQVIYERAKAQEQAAIGVFNNFGKQLASFLIPWLQGFQSDCIVLGGSISHASDLFLETMKAEFELFNMPIGIAISKLEDQAAILGAASLIKNRNNIQKPMEDYRLTNQPLLPLHQIETKKESYTLYPAFHLEEGKIYEGIDQMVDYIISQKTVMIDGYGGILWRRLKDELMRVLAGRDLKAHLSDTTDWFYPEEKINAMVAPYLGEEGGVWGTKFNKDLIDFFDPQKIEQDNPDQSADINIVIGTGAALARWEAPVIYFDLPKNELQYRMRARYITNLGSREVKDPREMYKRFYFVDWPVLNKHKKSILNRISVIADGQRPDAITWMYAGDLQRALQTMSENVFRVRPWFEAGAWGGHWMQRNIEGISKDEINYAWSFELITPENGLLLESDRLLLEISFDFLMFAHNNKILGEKFAARFGDEFPVRFDFLDTVDGGNLSIQCHPSVEYIKKNFGENFTQDETYYILDAEKDAGVYLGFNENINPEKFRKKLEESNNENTPVEVTDYVQYHPAKKHDFFLIPHGTIHSAAAGNLVLEISATPYIFTFKMYDWLRLDLNGDPRPINIDHAFNNLQFDYKGDRVQQELISKPALIAEGADWKLIHLPTHRDHFYDLHRYEFKDSVQIFTKGSCNILMLVEGSSITVETKNGFRQQFHYAETFVIPAAAESYTIINEGEKEAKVLKAFLKNQD